MAIQEFGKLGQVYSEALGAQIDAGNLVKLLVSAMADPGVREWLTQEYPESVSNLAAMAHMYNANVVHNANPIEHTDESNTRSDVIPFATD